MKFLRVSVAILLGFLLVATTTLAVENLLCLKNHTVLETAGDAVLSVFIDTDHGPGCNISIPKSIQEVATALFTVQSLNKLEYVPGVPIGLRVYDTCNDEASVYKQALVSAMEMDCSAHYDLGILAPLRYVSLLEPLENLDVVPVHTYSTINLTVPLIDVLIDFIATRYVSIDLVLVDSRSAYDRFMKASQEAGICVKSDLLSPDPESNTTEIVVVAIGNHDQIYGWLQDRKVLWEDNVNYVWIFLPLDSSSIDEFLPEGSFVIKPEQFPVNLSSAGLSGLELSEQVPASTLLQSPYLLSVGKTIVETAKTLKELHSKSCPGDAGANCVLPRFNTVNRQTISNADLYEILRVPATAHSTRYVVSRKSEGVSTDVAAYKIDATSAKYQVIAEKEAPRQIKLCVKKLVKNCDECVNFKLKETDSEPEEESDEPGILKPNIWVPIFLTIVCFLTLACIGVLVFIIFRYYVEEILDGNPALTIVLIVATILMLLSVVPFCLEDKTMGAEYLNSRKIYASTISFGIAFSVILTRSLFLAFSTAGVFSNQHINGYLQGLMLFFMAGVEVSIASMYFVMSADDSAEVMRSAMYIGLLSYDIFLLLAMFVAVFFVAQIQRNYREGMCFFATTIGIVVNWAVWLTCFLIMSPPHRDVIVCYGILGTACMIIIGILVPRTYFMYELFAREKDIASRFEATDLGPDPRMNRQALDLQARQPFYDYVNSPVASGAATAAATAMVQASPQQMVAVQQHQPTTNWYGSASPMANVRRSLRESLRRRTSPEPRRTPGYNNYAFRPEIRELDAAAAASAAGPYVIPRLYVDDPDFSRSSRLSVQSPLGKSSSSSSSNASRQQRPTGSASSTVTKTVKSSGPEPVARYALPRSLVRKAKSKAGSEQQPPEPRPTQDERSATYGAASGVSEYQDRVALRTATREPSGTTSRGGTRTAGGSSPRTSAPISADQMRMKTEEEDLEDISELLSARVTQF